MQLEMISKRRGGTVWIPIQINEHSAEPLYHQIEVQLRASIVSGQLAEVPCCRPFVS